MSNKNSTESYLFKIILIIIIVIINIAALIGVITTVSTTKKDLQKKIETGQVREKTDLEENIDSGSIDKGEDTMSQIDGKEISSNILKLVTKDENVRKSVILMCIALILLGIAIYVFIKVK